MNALYLTDLRAKVRRGLEGRVRQGRSGGGLCYGYDVVREIDLRGEPVYGGRSINHAKAAVVCSIFEAFAAGKSPRVIARGLNDERISGPGGRPWSETAIRGHALRRTGILHNELYVGRLVWNKQRYLKDPITGRRLARINPENEWIVTNVPELRIVDDVLWQRVHSRLATIRNSERVTKARAKKFWLDRRPKHLLTGLMICGNCGASLDGAPPLPSSSIRAHGKPSAPLPGSAPLPSLASHSCRDLSYPNSLCGAVAVTPITSPTQITT